jgi:hypothetical protein
LSAKVAVVKPDYLWSAVEGHVRTALFDAFGFERRELAQDLLLSRVLTVMQSVAGVAYVDVDVLAAVSEADVVTALSDGLVDELTRQDRVRALPARTDASAHTTTRRFRPAQLVYLDPRVPDTILLTERTT